MKPFFKYFLQGLLYIAPLAVTLYIIYLIFNFIDSLLEDILVPIIGIPVPGVGILIIVLILTFVGFIGQTILAKPLKLFVKNFVLRIPVLNVIYSAFNDFFMAFIGKEKKFNRPVLVTVNSITNLEKVGFLTEEDLHSLGEPDKVAVYFPHSYNFSGELFIVSRDLVKPLNLNASDAMKFVVSGGVAGLHQKETTDET